MSPILMLGLLNFRLAVYGRKIKESSDLCKLSMTSSHVESSLYHIMMVNDICQDSAHSFQQLQAVIH